MEDQSTKTSKNQDQTAVSRSRRKRRLLILLPVVLVLLLLSFHLIENWRGKRAWDVYQQEVKKAGGKLDPVDFDPVPVPEEQNFAMIPLLQPLFTVPLDEDSEEYQRLVAIRASGAPWQGEPPPRIGMWRKGEKAKLALWRTYYRTDTNIIWGPLEQDFSARDVVTALSRYDDEFVELREGIKRPYARFPVIFEENGDPTTWRVKYLETLRNLTMVLKLRALAVLEAAGPEEAITDVELMLRLSDSLRGNHFLLDHLVRLNLLDHSLQPIWEGLIAHQWRDEQLEHLKKLLQGHDLIADFQRVMETERAYTIEMIAFLRRNPRLLSKISGAGADSPVSALLASIPSTNSAVASHLVACIIPEGWFYFEQVAYGRALDDLYLKELPKRMADVRVSAEKERVRRLQEWTAESGSLKTLRQHDLFARLFLPHLASTMATTLAGQMKYRLAETAVALEQYWRLHGKYPEALPGLVPQFLEQVPLDLIDGQPLRYRTNPSGSYDLWSIGWDEHDDGAAIGVGEVNGLESMQLEKGDWVWTGKSSVKTIKK